MSPSLAQQVQIINSLISPLIFYLPSNILLGLYLFQSCLILLDVNRTLLTREPNMYFTYSNLGSVSRALRRLSNAMSFGWSLDRLYDEVLSCFREYGSASRGRTNSPRHEPWMSFLSDDELEVCFKYTGPCYLFYFKLLERSSWTYLLFSSCLSQRVRFPSQLCVR